MVSFRVWIVASALLVSAACGEEETTGLGTDSSSTPQDAAVSAEDATVTRQDASNPPSDAGWRDAGSAPDVGSGSCHGLFDPASCALRADCVPASCDIGCGPSFLGCFEQGEPLPVCGGQGVPCIPDPCSQVFDAEGCSNTPGCHPVFNDPGTCGCAPAGCCAQFSYCATGEFADCTGAGLACRAASPFCEGPYVVGYRDACYEGCVLQEDCAD